MSYVIPMLINNQTRKLSMIVHLTLLYIKLNLDQSHFAQKCHTIQYLIKDVAVFDVA